jgi:8-oxo-dGTP diphosphatase
MDITKNKITATLVFLTRERGGQKEVLLAKKTRKIGVGCFNGFGGSLDKRETPRDCVVRELKEESGLVAKKEDLFFAGVVTFHNQREDGGVFSVRVFVFILKEWKGKLKPSDEMTEQEWFPINKLPLKQMMAADRDFVPQILNGHYHDKLLRGEAWYGPNQKVLLKLTQIKWVGRSGDVN